MSITAETAKAHANDPAVLCCRAEGGITIEPANLEDPAIFDELVDSGLLNLDGCLKIGQVLGAKLTKTSDSLCPLTADNVEGFKTDDELAKDILHYATLGGDVYDVMGDIFDRSENEITYNAQAIKKQKQLIDNLHKMGKQVLMSSHTFKFMDCDEVIKIAKAQESRGADIVKIVAASNNEYECLENLKTSLKLKEKLNVPFLFLSVGEYSRVHRLIGTHYGSCMWLCVDRYDAFATPAQPLIETIKNLRDNIILS